MANYSPVVIVSGQRRLQQAADNLLVGAGVLSSAGANLTLDSALTQVRVATGKSFVAAGGATGLDFSAASGTFLTSTGAVTIGPGAVGVSGLTTFSAIGTALTVTNNASLGTATVIGLLTGTGGATVGGGAVALTGNAASSFTTSAGALTLTGAVASTWSTVAGALTVSGFAGLNLQTAGTTRLALSGAALTVQAGATLGTTGTGNINLPNNGSAAFQIESVSVAATVTAANLATLTNGSNADALHVHSGGGGTPGGATTQFQYNNAGAFAGATTLLNRSGQICLGTGAATIPLNYDLNVDSGMGLFRTGATTNSGVVTFERTRGSFASPTFVEPADRLGMIEFKGYTDNIYAGARILAEAASTWPVSGASAPTNLSILVTPLASSTPALTAFFASTRRVGFGGNSDPSETVTIDGRLALQSNTAPTVTAGYGKPFVSSADNQLHFFGEDGVDRLVSDGGVTTLSYLATTNLDLSPALKGYRTLALTGDVTFTTSNRAAGNNLSVRIVSDGTPRLLAFPLWTFIGGTVPTSIAANKTAVLSITAFGPNDTDVVAAYSVQS